MIHLEILPDDIVNNIYRNFLISLIACDLETLTVKNITSVDDRYSLLCV